MMRALVASAFCAVAIPSAMVAQQYRGRLDVRGQAVSFRGLVSDSIDASLVAVGATGGLETPDGYAVRCGAGTYCYFRRAGPVLSGVPVTTTASVVTWGFGVEGLTFRATGRLSSDLAGDHVWPGFTPAGQLVEGFFEYQRSATMIARLGRQQLSSRLEPIGFDGGWLRYHWEPASIEVTGYGGWGLGQAAVLTTLSPALNPLDEWRPRDRQIVAGVEAAWIYRAIDVRSEYRREMDPETDYFVSERAALSVGARHAAFRLTSGLDYNIAEGRFGNADATLTYLNARGTVSATVRRYRPYFSLWTLWGAFSPVPYDAMSISAQARATTWLSVNGRAERYRYDNAEASTALVPQLETGGWRLRAGASAAPNARWLFDGNVGSEHGPGASSRSADITVSYIPSDRSSFDVYAGTLARPLELRYYDATSRWLGARSQWQFSEQWRLWGDVAFVSDDRDRPDASAWTLDQFRLRSGVSLTFGSSADRTPLPPARPTPP